MQTEVANRLPSDATSRAVLRHMLATLAYRAAKVPRDTPPDFGARTFGAATRQPTRIVAHMADLMAWASRSPRANTLGKRRERRLERRGHAVLRSARRARP